MFGITCLDRYGEIVTSLNQWDINQTLYIQDSDFSNAPVFQFCNKNSERALCVQSKLVDATTLTVDVPNSLLREPYPIICYVFLEESDESGKVVNTIRIPVNKRVQPTDYEYTDNINIVYISELITEVKNLNEKLSNEELIRIESENIRILNENQRIENETNRQVSTAAVIQACKDQTQECENATSETLKAKKAVDDLLYDIDGGNAYTNPDYMFQIDGGNCENNNG